MAQSAMLNIKHTVLLSLHTRICARAHEAKHVRVLEKDCLISRSKRSFRSLTCGYNKKLYLQSNLSWLRRRVTLRQEERACPSQSEVPLDSLSVTLLEYGVLLTQASTRSTVYRQPST